VHWGGLLRDRAGRLVSLPPASRSRQSSPASRLCSTPCQSTPPQVDPTQTGSEAPFIRILVLYSNMLEDPGVIADDNIGDAQIKFLEAALDRVKSEQFGDHNEPTKN
jgi:hypothetical protein